MGMGTELGAEKGEEGKESEQSLAAWRSHRGGGVESWGSPGPLKTSVTCYCKNQA